MLDYLISLGPYQWIGLFFGIFYVILAARSSIWCWYVGIISCGAIAIEHLTHTKLYSDMWLQLFYIIMAFYGIYEWKKGEETPVKPVQNMQAKDHVKVLVIGVIAAIPIGLYFQYFSDASFPIVDAVTTSFSIVANTLLIKRYLQNWLYWIVVDSVYVYLYWDTAAPLFSILFIIYIGVSIYGYRGWKKEILATLN